MLGSKSIKIASSPSMSTRFQSRHTDSPITPSAASQYDMEHFVVKSFASLPVLVNEVLSTRHNNSDASVEFSENGWAWLVSSMKIFVWKIGQVRSKHICKELILDSSPNKQYHAQLALVGDCQSSKHDGAISAVAVTTAGHIKYWPNIIRSVTSTVYLDEPELETTEEFLRILPFKGKGYIAVTTNGNIYQLNPDGYTITRTQLRCSMGVLAGIGRRVSSLFFSQDRHDEVINLDLIQSSKSSCDVVLLTANNLQKRRISSPGGYDQLLCQVPINDLLAGKISQVIWGKSRTDFEMLPMDVTVLPQNKSLVILVACLESSNIIKYCVCVCPLSVFENTHDNAASLNQIEVALLNHTDRLSDEEEFGDCHYRLATPKISSHGLQYALIWRTDQVIIKSFGQDSVSLEESLPIESTGSILGVGEFGKQAVLLESTKGLLSVEPKTLCPDLSFCEGTRSMLDSPNVSTEFTVRDQLACITPKGPNTPTSKGSKMQAYDLDSGVDQVQRLQSAFIHFSHMNIRHARSIIEETFTEADNIASLKNAVISMSLELIDDFPARDPRWAESLPQGNSSSSSLILQHQLRDKQKAHQLFLNFLNEVSLWDALGSAISSGQCGQLVLIEHQEKLEAAVALANKHVEKRGILDPTIRKVVEKRGDRISNELTAEDVFYRQVSRIQDIVEGILDVEEDAISNNAISSKDLCRLIMSANEVFETIFSVVHALRKHRGSYQNVKNIEFCPWTVSSRSDNLREALLRQHEMIFSHAIPQVDDSQCRSTLQLHAVSLADIVLSEYMGQLESLASVPSLSARLDEVTESFQRHRNATISPILDAGLLEKAGVLAEKFKDFNILMEIWDRKDSDVLLSEYVSKFEKYGFIDTFFAWLLERGKFRKLLHYATCDTIASDEFTKRAADFMSSHPKISWHRQIKINDFMSAHKTLLYLAVTESNSSAVKNHYVSLSKLAAAFSDGPQSIIEKAVSDSTSQQVLLKHQETLPSSILQELGVSVDNMPVYSAEELIKLYIGDNNLRANEVDFMKALDLLAFIPQNFGCEEEGMDLGVTSEITDLKHQIWSKAIMRDSWSDINCGIDNLQASSHTILAKTLQLASQSGALAEYLPDLEQLFEEELLASIKNNASSQYLVRLNFQHFEQQAS